MKRWTPIWPHLVQNMVGECSVGSKALQVLPIKRSLSGDWQWVAAASSVCCEHYLVLNILCHLWRCSSPQILDADRYKVHQSPRLPLCTTWNGHQRRWAWLPWWERMRGTLQVHLLWHVMIIWKLVSLSIANMKARGGMKSKSTTETE